MDVARLVSFCTGAVLVLGLAFGVGLYSGAHKNALYAAVKDAKDRVEWSIAAIRETPVLVPTTFLQPARHPGEGVTVNRRGGDGALVLMAGFFEGGNQLRLVRRDGSVVARWPVRFSELFPRTDHMTDPPATDWNIDTHGSLALADGSVVFTFEGGGLVKLDRCGGVVWTLEHSTHHSVETAADGGFWVPGRRRVTSDALRLPPFPLPYDEDLVLRVSDEGEVLSEVSVPQLLYENGLETLLTATGYPFYPDVAWDREIVHLNSVTELSRDVASAFPGFEAGDLALSLREYNLVMVVDPDGWRVKWHQTGPWRRQHDPEFGPDGRIVVFNNNTYWNHGEYAQDAPREYASRIERIDPASRRVETVYGARPGEELFTMSRGKVQLLDGGGFLITEFDGGRAFEIDAAGTVVWEYVNRYDDTRVAEITEARLYPEGYFAGVDWSCPES